MVSDKKKTLFLPFRALDQERHKVLEIDSKGNLYLYRSALLCKNEIIKRLTEDKFKLVEPSTIGKVQSFTSYNQNSGVTSLAPLPNLRTTDALNASAVRRLPTPQLSTKYTYNSHRQATKKKKKMPIGLWTTCFKESTLARWPIREWVIPGFHTSTKSRIHCNS